MDAQESCHHKFFWLGARRATNFPKKNRLLFTYRSETLSSQPRMRAWEVARLRLAGTFLTARSCRRRTRIICGCMGIVTVDSGGITTVRAIPILSHHQVRCSWVACSVFQGAQSCAFWQVPYRRSPLLNTVCVSRLIRHAHARLVPT